MDVLCGLFDTVAAVGEVLGRTKEKDQELACLSNTVESISASVRTFAGNLPPEEREAVFNSNKIFPDLLHQMQRCAEVLYGPQTLEGGHRADRRRLIDQEVKQLTEGNKQALSGVLAKLKKGIEKGAGILNESLEIMSSKVGVVGTLLHLPEDELEKIREASRQLQRMVPLLNLAISAYVARGQKRAFEGDLGSRPTRFLRLEAGAFASPQTGVLNQLDVPAASPETGRAVDDLPVLRLQPVSDLSWGVERLPEITSDMLRPASAAALSSTSLDSSEAAAKRVFGRQEVKDRLPQGVTVPLPSQQDGVGRDQELFRFVSRDHFMLEVLPVPQSPSCTMQGSLDMETLHFGIVPEDTAATLAFGGVGPEDKEDPSHASPDLELASVSAMTATGIHVKPAGETTWRWSGKSAGRRLKANDIIGVLLESPPGSFQNNRMSQDLQEDQARCFLGLELLPSR